MFTIGRCHTFAHSSFLFRLRDRSVCLIWVQIVFHLSSFVDGFWTQRSGRGHPTLIILSHCCCHCRPSGLRLCDVREQLGCRESPREAARDDSGGQEDRGELYICLSDPHVSSDRLCFSSPAVCMRVCVYGWGCGCTLYFSVDGKLGDACLESDWHVVSWKQLHGEITWTCFFWMCVGSCLLGLVSTAAGLERSPLWSMHAVFMCW